MHMRVGGPDTPKHDREQCLKLARRKFMEAKQAIGGAVSLVESSVHDILLLEAPMEVLIKLYRRVRPKPDCDIILAIVKVKLGTLLAEKYFGSSDGSESLQEKLAPLERIVTLLGEGYPVMLHDYEYLLGTAMGFEGLFEQAKALVELGREAEALAWMREFIPRFEAALKD